MRTFDIVVQQALTGAWKDGAPKRRHRPVRAQDHVPASRLDE
jgi:hypothetical protein